ncbi:MAG TPA: tripartite tricarboxylate transporter substrate binding protein [Burkholderiales bacterium]|nr:tripartite tricarboxylate transporter substrate binding protein [Burkholderiales bacterium]
MIRKLLLALLAAPCLALAQGYPSKPIRMVVPFPPGGTTDLIARLVQPRFQEFLGQNVVIENKGGAGGSVGAADVAQSPPDGYTILLVFDTHAVNHHIYKVAPDPFKSFDHQMLMVTSPSTLIGVSKFAPATLQELVAYAKANPGKVTYATAGAASSNHLGALLLEQVAGIKMTHVHYKGGGPMIQAILGNQIDIAFISTPLILPHIQAGKAKAIAVGGKQRMPVLPNVASMSETFPGFEQISWFGLLTPAGVSKDVSQKLRREMARTLDVPEVKQRLQERGFDVVAAGPEEFLRFVRAESDKLGKLIRDNNIAPE